MNPYLESPIRRWWRRCLGTIRHWWQRRTRGWDDSELWNLDLSLARLILPRLRAFRANAHGCPGSYCVEGPDDPNAFDNWCRDLDKMIAAFEFVLSDKYWMAESMQVRDEGLALFAKYYGALWD